MHAISFLQEVGFDFALVHNEGKDAVVIRTELDYKQSLRPGMSLLFVWDLSKTAILKLIFSRKLFALLIMLPA